MKLYLIDAVHELCRKLCRTSDQVSSKFTFYVLYFTYTSAKSSNQFLDCNYETSSRTTLPVWYDTRPIHK